MYIQFHNFISGSTHTYALLSSCNHFVYTAGTSSSVKSQYATLLSISKTIQIRQTRHARHSWRSKDELISNVLLWTPSHKCASVSWTRSTYLQQLCTDTGHSLEDLPSVMDYRDEWQERVREIHTTSMMIFMCRGPHGLKENASVGWLAKPYLKNLCADTGYFVRTARVNGW